PIGSSPPHRLPRRARHLGVLLDVAAPLVGEAERAPAGRLLGLDQPLVGELLQGGVDRAGTGPPGAAAALLDLGHDLVAVARALAQQGQDRRAHVASPGLGPGRRLGWPGPAPRPARPPRPAEAARLARDPARPRPAGLLPPEGMLPRPARPARAMPGGLRADRLLDMAQHLAQTAKCLEETGIELPGR